MAMKYDLRTGTHGIEKGFFASIEYNAENKEYTFGAPQPFTGLRSISVETEQESTNFYADDQVHLTITGAKNVTGSMNLYQLPINFLTNHLGMKVDSNGALLDTGDYKPFVLGYTELVTDANGSTSEKLTIFYNCKATAPTSESATDEEAVELKEIEIPLTMSASQTVTDEDGKAVTKAELVKTSQNTSIFEQAYSTVYIPS